MWRVQHGGCYCTHCSYSIGESLHHSYPYINVWLWYIQCCSVKHYTDCLTFEELNVLTIERWNVCMGACTNVKNTSRQKILLMTTLCVIFHWCLLVGNGVVNCNAKPHTSIFKAQSCIVSYLRQACMTRLLTWWQTLWTGKSLNSLCLTTGHKHFLVLRSKATHATTPSTSMFMKTGCLNL